ncbi:MAG: BrnA antitoxin family protein [Candidatus Competibacteraceae bacterium]|nr:BrnA antitoxin family protein [Candidatus Competibacteraceae bacterium]
MSKTVRFKADLNNLPPLTDAQKAELKALSEMPDSEIDYSDIPPLDDAFWKNAVRNPFYKPTKTSTTVRVDSDVLAWLKSQGKGYQTRINAILREAMLRAFERDGA